MRIIFVNGSSRKNLSVSDRIIHEIGEKIKHLNPRAVIEVIVLREERVLYCQGCSRCFRDGACELDKLDNFDVIKRKLLNADIIFFVSPVYANNVTGLMKNFIDRITYWTHLMLFSKKISGAIAVTSSSGGEFVKQYLGQMLTYLGSHCVMAGVYASGGYVDKFAQIDQFANEVVFRLEKHIKEGSKNKSNEMLDRYFKAMKTIMASRLNMSINDSESLYWERSGMIHFEDYQEYIDSLER